MGFLMHHQCFLPYGKDIFGIVPVEGNDTGFVDDHLVIVNDQGIGRTQIDSDFLREKVEKSHVFSCDLKVHSAVAKMEEIIGINKVKASQLPFFPIWN
jgi:hypothetical protein